MAAGERKKRSKRHTNRGPGRRPPATCCLIGRLHASRLIVSAGATCCRPDGAASAAAAAAATRRQINRSDSESSPRGRNSSRPGRQQVSSGPFEWATKRRRRRAATSGRVADLEEIRAADKRDRRHDPNQQLGEGLVRVGQRPRWLSTDGPVWRRKVRRQKSEVNCRQSSAHATSGRASRASAGTGNGGSCCNLFPVVGSRAPNPAPEAESVH